jgi:serine/threonine-protein kinase
MSQPSSPRGADRNLLFGILALQMDFIDRDGLIQAMHAWVLDKDRSLGAILHAQGTLGEEELSLLEALVAKHLQKHDNDPEQSLHALVPVPWAHAELQRLADPDLQASLAQISGSAPVPVDPYATDCSPVGVPATNDSRFRILRPHASGGLGVVYVAHDEELGREVALKEIQLHHADNPASRARFVLEAEVTGGLEHPGIVPVYGLGAYADGRPFYAMRLIRGSSLKEAIEGFHRVEGAGHDAGQRDVALRKLLRRFFDVCNALEYAHSRGILHRDLKPSNIMLGKYGETLILDWGLAKPLRRNESLPAEATTPEEAPLRPSVAGSSAPTEMGRALGTPAYMSPEQARGRLDLLGPASDVYSLGATLYCLLTGRSPFTDPDVAVVLVRVERSDFPWPRFIKPDVPPALEAVCLRAMALQPQDRYPTVAELGRDIERWLDDQPVSAWSEPWPERVRRWARRHKPLVAGAVGLLAAAVGALGISTVLILQEQAHTEAARAQAQTHYETAEQHRQTADDLRRHSERNYDKARKTMDELLARFEQPGSDEVMQAERQELLGQMLAFYESVLPEQRDDPRALREVGQIYARVGEILQKQREHARALPYLEQALTLQKKLYPVDSFPSGHSDLARSLYNLGAVFVARGENPRAQPYLEQALAMRQRLYPQERFPQGHAELVRSLNQLAILHEHQKEHGRARPYLEQALAMCQSLYPQERYPQGHPDLAESLNNLGAVLSSQREYGKALPHLAQALAVRLKLYPEGHPLVAQSMHNLAALYQAQGEYARAEPLFQQALAIRKRVEGERPPSYALSIAREPMPQNLSPQQQKRLQERDALLQEMIRFGEQGKLEEAVHAGEKMLALERTIFGEAHVEIASSQEALAQLYEAREDFTSAVKARQEILRIRTQLLGEKHWRVTDARLAMARSEQWAKQDREQRQRLRLAEQLHSRVVAFYRAGKLAEAIVSARQAVELWRTVLGERTPDYAQSLSTLALMHQTRREFAEAEPLYLQSVQVRQQVMGEHHPLYATSLHNLAALYQARAAYGKAEPLFRQALEIREQTLGKRHPDYMRSLSSLAWLLANCPDAKRRDAPAAVKMASQAIELAPQNADHFYLRGVAHYRAGDFKQALANLDAALRLRKENDGQEGFFIAMVQQRLGNPDESRRWFERAAGWMEQHRPDDPDLRRSRAEAAEVLGIERDAPKE